VRVTEPRAARDAAWPVKVATAPVNFGIYSADDPFISASEYARIAADCGYEGTDLGPHGYLDEVLADADRGPALAGGWHDLRFGQQEGFADDLSALDDTARLLHTRNRFPDMSSFAPKPTLACPPSGPLDAAGWGLLVRQAYRAASRCREAPANTISRLKLFSIWLGTGSRVTTQAWLRSAINRNARPKRLGASFLISTPISKFSKDRIPDHLAIAARCSASAPNCTVSPALPSRARL